MEVKREVEGESEVGEKETRAERLSVVFHNARPHTHAFPILAIPTLHHLYLTKDGKEGDGPRSSGGSGHWCGFADFHYCGALLLPTFRPA